MLGVFPTGRKIIDLLSPITTFKRREGSAGGKVTMVDQPLYQIPQEGIFETLAGLEKRITAKLQFYGYKVHVQRLLDNKLECNFDMLNAKDLDELQDRQDQVDVIGLVVDHEGGFMVDCPTGWGKSYAIKKICKVLPKAKIAVVAPGIDVTRSLYTGLKREIRDVGRVGDGYRDIRRITVSTMESITRLSKVEWDLLLFDEAHRAGGPSTANNIAEVFHTAKCVGFSASPIGRTDNADLVVEALFGKVIYKVTYNQAKDRGSVVPIRVYMFDSDHGPMIGDGARSVTRNRKGIWCNLDRNQLIASIAKSVPDDEQCLIMVSTANHAMQLKKLLPNYTVVFSSVKKSAIEPGTLKMIPGLQHTGNFDQKYRQYLTSQFERGELKKAISTGVWNTGVNFKQLAYLIRAEGTSSDIQSIQTPGRLSRTYDGKECGVLIDFMDNFDGVLHNRSLKRRRSYVKAGWELKEIKDPGPLDIQSIFKQG
jgi:superfamily II DNA or RNA helicase